MIHIVGMYVSVLPSENLWFIMAVYHTWCNGWIYPLNAHKHLSSINALDLGDVEHPLDKLVWLPN